MNTIPFWLPEVEVLTEVKGLVYLDEEFLVLEITTALLGEFNDERTTIKIEPEALDAVHHERGLFVDRLSLRPKKRTLLRAVPGTHRDALRLKIWRRHRADVATLLQRLRDRLGEAARS